MPSTGGRVANPGCGGHGAHWSRTSEPGMQVPVPLYASGQVAFRPAPVPSTKLTRPTNICVSTAARLESS